MEFLRPTGMKLQVFGAAWRWLSGFRVWLLHAEVLALEDDCLSTRRLACLRPGPRRAGTSMPDVAWVRAKQSRPVQILASVFASSSAGILQPPMMRSSAPDRDVRGRRTEENEEGFTQSILKKTPPNKAAVSDRLDHYVFRSVLATDTHHRPVSDSPTAESLGWGSAASGCSSRVSCRVNISGRQARSGLPVVAFQQSQRCSQDGNGGCCPKRQCGRPHDAPS